MYVLIFYMLVIIFTTLLMITSIPLGFLLSRILHWEKPITDAYFPPILWVLAIASAVFLSIELLYALTTIYLFFMILTWRKVGK